jgi:phasin family protein
MSEVENTAGEMKPAAEAATPAAPVAKIDLAAEKAYAEAAAKAVPAAPKAVKAVPAAETETPAAPKKTPLAKKAAKIVKPAAKTVKKTATKTKPAAAKLPAKKPVLAKKAAKPAAAPKTNTVTKLKETVMETVETVKNTDLTATAKEVFADVQTRAKTAYAKGTEFAGEATEFTKANLEAVVESGKIFFTGAQELLKDNVETGKTVIETVTEDAKKVAAIKSPTELMQLQGEIARRNFDAVVAYGSKRTEAWVKLYNDAFAPISNRVSVAVEKVKTAA